MSQSTLSRLIYFYPHGDKLGSLIHISDGRETEVIDQRISILDKPVIEKRWSLAPSIIIIIMRYGGGDTDSCWDTQIH